MNRTRLQQLAGIRPLFEQGGGPQEAYIEWEDEMKEQFIEQNPQVTDNPEELQIEDDGQVYHRESNQRWPAGTVTPFDDWYADQQGTKTDAAHERGKEEGWGKEQQEQAEASGMTRAVAAGLADQFIEKARYQTKSTEEHEQHLKELMKAVHTELAARGYQV